MTAATGGRTSGEARGRDRVSSWSTRCGMTSRSRSRAIFAAAPFGRVRSGSDGASCRSPETLRRDPDDATDRKSVGCRGRALAHRSVGGGRVEGTMPAGATPWATVLIRGWNGCTGSPTQTDKTSGTIRYKQNNDSTVDAVNPLVKPSANIAAILREIGCSCASARPARTGSITNLQWYTDGTNNYGTGITAFIRGRTSQADHSRRRRRPPTTRRAEPVHVQLGIAQEHGRGHGRRTVLRDQHGHRRLRHPLDDDRQHRVGAAEPTASETLTWSYDGPPIRNRMNKKGQRR